MPNLGAMQDEQLLELIRDVEKLERLRNSIAADVHFNCAERQYYKCLIEELFEARVLVQGRWKELMEEDL